MGFINTFIQPKIYQSLPKQMMNRSESFLTLDTSDQIHQRPRASPVAGGAQRCGANPSQGSSPLSPTPPPSSF